MNDTPSLSLSDEIDKLQSFVQTAQRLIYEGKAVDVTSLEEKIDHLCQSLEKLPPNNGRELAPALEKLMTSVDQLEKDIDLQHDALTERLQLNETRANPLFAQEVSEDDDKD
jgi:uncharacterized protein Yka (UPF0111/DUF47 family)